MKIIVHRGTHQIGGSCIELATENTRIILDIGQELPSIDETEFQNKSQLPQVKGLYNGGEKAIDALFISHYHGDHVGLIGNVHPDVPIYIGEKAAKILNMTAQFTGSKACVSPAGYLVSGQEIKVGDFSIVPYLVDHSAFDAYAFVIYAENKCIVYTGDIREHGKKKLSTYFFRQKLPKEIDALLIEGTMMGRTTEVIETEEQIEQKAYDFMVSRKDRPIFVIQSSANIDRLVGMYRATKRSGRIFVMDIFTANIVSQVGGRIPNPYTFKDVRVFYPFHLTRRMFKEPDGKELMKQFSQHLISRKELGERKDYCMLVRDTMLSDLQHINNLEGAGIIYSMWSGYLKTERLERMMNYAAKMNMEIIHLHTSGHAGIKTLQNIAKSCSPERIIPIHTEYPERFIDKFANVVIVNDNEAIFI